MGIAPCVSHRGRLLAVSLDTSPSVCVVPLVEVLDNDKADFGCAQLQGYNFPHTYLGSGSPGFR
jgi:hypothetical protein